MAAHASERAREDLRHDEPGPKDRVRQGLLAVARLIEVLDLPGGEGLLRNEHLGELGLRARGLACRRLQRCDPRGGANDPHDLLRRLVLRNVRGRTRCEGEVPDSGVQREEDDLRVGEVVPEHPGDFESGHAGHRVVEHDHIGTKLECLPRGLVPIRRFPHDLEVRVGVDERAEALAYSEVVVGDQDSLWHE